MEFNLGTGRAVVLSLIFWAWPAKGWLVVLFSAAVAITYPSALGFGSFHTSSRLAHVLHFSSASERNYVVQRHDGGGDALTYH